MATTLAITDQFQIKYESIWRQLVQQSDSRFSKAVTYETGCTGEVKYVDQIKPIDVIEITQRLQATAISEIETNKRAIFPQRFAVPKHFDEFDEVQLAAQSLPTSATFREMKGGVNRQLDDLVIAAATGTAQEGASGQTSIALPAGQKLLVDRGTGTNENFTIEKWLDVKELFEQNEVVGQDAEAMGDTPYIALGSSQLRGLYDEAKVTSSDYAGELTALYRGEIDQFLGFKVIRSERLSVNTDIRTCFAWVPSGIALDVWVNPTFKISERNDYNEAIQLRGKFMAGASRLEEEKVVEIPCDETV